MNTQSNIRKVTYYPSTHPGVMTISFMLISALLLYLIKKFADSSVESWQGYFACSLFWIGAAFYAIRWMHTAYFTSEGIVFFRLGKEYRRVPWNSIIQIGLAKEYKATKLTLVITPFGCPIYDDYTQTTTSYVERHRRDLILLDGTKQNLDAVHIFYGELSYNAKDPNRQKQRI